MHSIQTRKISLRPGADTPRHWFGGMPFETHFFNALSSFFPEGERFFIQSVRAFADQVTDPELASDVAAFVHQEGQHSLEHDAHLDILTAQGFTGLRWFNKNMCAVLRWLLRNWPGYSLALTAANEHVTTNLADALLTNPERWLQPMSKDMEFLWEWHVVEETEHKAVAYDVYEQTGHGYKLRAGAMIHVTIVLSLELFARHLYLLAKDGYLIQPSEWLRGTTFLWGRQGLLRAMVKGHWAYFRRGFHPWQVDNRDKIEHFKATYAERFAID